MGLGSVVMVIFFTICGGPIGSEEVLAAGGPAIGMGAMLVFPWLYCVPVALISAELSTQFPEDGSFTLWVAACFGRFWAFQDGYWSWVSGVLDSAMYPVFAAELILGVGSTGSLAGVALVIGLALAASSLNFMGVQIVGRALIALGVVVMLPYSLLVGIWGWQLVLPFSGPAELATDFTHSPVPDPAVAAASAGLEPAAHFAPTPQALTGDKWTPDLVGLLHLVFWSYSGWDSISTFAGEVHNPKRTFPLALMVSVVLVTLAYVLPLSAGLLYPGTPHWATWKEGSFHEIGAVIGGKALAGLLGVSSALSLLAMYCAEMFIDSFLLLGMAEQGLAPRVFAKRDKRFDSPYVAIVASLVVICVFCPLFDFVMLMQVNNALTCLSVLIELVAAILLRFRSSDKAYNAGPEEYRTPLGNMQMLAMLLPAIATVTLVIATTLFMVDFVVQASVLGFILLGGMLYFVCAERDLRTD